MPVCNGCQVNFTEYGYPRHLAQSRNSACITIYKEMENYQPQTHSAPEAPENGPDCDHSDNGNGAEDRQDDGPELDEEEEAEAEGGVAEQERDWEPAIGAIDDYVSMDKEGLLGDEGGDKATHRAHRHGAEIPLLECQPHIVKFPLCSAGAIIPDSALADQPHRYDSHRSQLDPSCIWAPFTSQIDYEVAWWAKLWGQDEDKTQRLFHDLHTGKWWWRVQNKLEQDKPGATVIPILLLSDKTQVTMFRNKATYPIYITIGNLPKEIRRRPSYNAQILLGYLFTTKLEHITNKAARRRCLANLFHVCMHYIVESLVDAGKVGIPIASGDGAVCHGHPLVACYIRDYPEQVLVTGIKTGECPKCDTPADELGNKDLLFEPCDLGQILDALALVDGDPSQFTKACHQAGIKPIYCPFWEELPHCNIYQAITPDILHQLYQGLVKHLIAWLKSAFSEAELDARCKCLPPNHNIHLFMKGISVLSRVSGTKHQQICWFLLGIIIDIRLPNGASPARLICAVQGLLDFLYLTQYPCHSHQTLELLDDTLNHFHNNKSIFIDLGIRSSFNLPKLHSL
ncbi:hypothetical protein C8R48DRAFT_772463 [Suillus tomentosus]|nr:hypothetical protein C8R48DRAFT_772463 [Suillus tomentosus]